MVTSFAACRRRVFFACGLVGLCLAAALVFFSGCSDDSVSPGGGPSTIEWTVEEPKLLSYGLTSVWAASPSDVFAVGVRGGAVHFDGSRWEEMETGLSDRVDLQDVFGVSALCVYAVGEDGTVLRYDGAGWGTVAFPEPLNLAAVWAASETDVFVAGSTYQPSTIYRGDGSSWTQMEVPTEERLLDLWGSAPNDVYTVGDKGTMIHYDGTKWEVVSLPAGAAGKYLESVCGSSANDVYAVGTEVILHFDGNAWETIENVPEPPDMGYYWRAFARVWTEKPGDVYIATRYRSVLHYNGFAWQWIWNPKTLCGSSQTLGLWGSGSDVYVVGTTPRLRGTVLHYDGGKWESPTGPAEGLNGVWGSSDRDVFAVGEAGTILHFDGTGWSVMDGWWCNGLYAVWGTGPHDVFAVGWRDVWHFDGDVWGGFHDTEEWLADIWGTSHDNIFCVGEGGIHRFDGSVWHDQWTGIELDAVSGTDAGHVYAAGNRTFLRFDGKDWIVAPSSPDLRILDLDASAASGNVYAAGYGYSSSAGAVARFDGAEWTSLHELSVAGMGLWGVWATDHGFGATIAAVGGAPAVVSVYDGGRWEDVNIGETLPRSARGLALRAVWSPDGRTFFAVGDGGLIVRGER